MGIGSRRLLVACALLLASPLARAASTTYLADAGHAKKRGPGVRAMFDAAQQLFDAAKYPAALNAYVTLLHKYPGHVPAMIQAAKTLYRMDRYTDAAAYFGKVDLNELDAETSYEYGWTYFTLKNYEPALKAFQRVPSGHSLYDLANYYGGIAAIKLKKFDVAEDMLDKAVVLPDKLAKSRALYVKHVQALRLLHQRNDLAKEREEERQTLAMAVPRKKPKPEEVVVADPNAAYQGFKSIVKNTNVQYSSEQQANSNYNLAHNTFDSNVTSFDVLTGPLLLLPVRDGTRQGAIGVQLDLGAEDRSTTGIEQIIWAEATDTTLTRVFNQQLGHQFERAGKGDVDAWAEVPLPGSLWLAVGGEANYRYGNFEKGDRTGYYRGYLDLRGRYGFGNVGAEASYHSLLDPSGTPIAEIGAATLNIDGEIATKLTATAQANYMQLHYLGNGSTLDGPDSVVGMLIGATQLLPFGFKLKAQAAYTQENNELFHHVPSYQVVGADGQTFSGKASVEASPISFIVIGASAGVAATTWSLHQSSTSPSFDLSEPNNTQDVNLWAGLNLVF